MKATFQFILLCLFLLFCSSQTIAQCSIIVDSASNLLCFNMCQDGAIHVSSSGGMAPYSYTLSPSNVTNSNGHFYNVCAGNYTITSTDAMNCSTTMTVAISTPPQLIATETHTTSSCIPGCDGIITVIPSGGTPPYAIISNPTIPNMPSYGYFTNVCQNTYTIQATDVNGCNFNTIINNSPGNPLAPYVGPIYQVFFNYGPFDCAFPCWGAINLANPLPASILNYTLSSIPATIQNGTLLHGVCGDLNLNPYMITLTVTDSFQCTTSWNSLLNTGIASSSSPTALSLSSTIIDTACAAACSAGIVPVPQGGNPPYSITISGNSFTSLCNGTYTLLVTDALGCTATDTVIVQSPVQLPIQISPLNGSYCQNSSIQLSATGATSYTWLPGNINATSITVAPSNPTTYTVTGYSPNGCVGIDSILVYPMTTPTLTVQAFPSLQICQGDSIVLTATGANIINWNNGITNNSPFTPLATGVYVVIGIDTNGCSDTSSVTIIVDTNYNMSLLQLPLSSSPFPYILGNSTQFTAQVPIPANYSLDWYVNGVLFSTTNSPMNTINFTGLSLFDSVFVVWKPIGCFVPDSLASSPIYPQYPSSISVIGNEPVLTIYPNPASTEVYIDAEKEFTQYTIYNQQMSVIESKSFPSTKSKKLNIAALSNGIYFIKTNTGEMKKLVVQK
jgi:hypothetical protein